jgi:aquaporin Z
MNGGRMKAKSLAAELIGTFALVLAILAAALLAEPAGAGPLAVALAAGLAVAAMGYAVGPVSGGHFNPAVTLGLVAADRFDSADAVGYIAAQVAGALLAAGLLALVMTGALSEGPSVGAKWPAFADISNIHSRSNGYTLLAVALIEATATALLLIVVTGSTARATSAALAPLAIGFAYLVFYLVTLPVDGASLNPARSTATAVLAGGAPLAQLWLFWAAPIGGGVLGGAIGRWLFAEK